ncbi:uncharacterized protein BJX67DRAFT_116495 [Aspergillus lucknowensis]|uniref:Uncharacterized protein n=1 Tax=Aspergillus lucknowensis TaxID=176173 RepID=A0ABR4LQI2_9EURO
MHLTSQICSPTVLLPTPLAQELDWIWSFLCETCGGSDDSLWRPGLPRKAFHPHFITLSVLLAHAATLRSLEPPHTRKLTSNNLSNFTEPTPSNLHRTRAISRLRVTTPFPNPLNEPFTQRVDSIRNPTLCHQISLSSYSSSLFLRSPPASRWQPSWTDLYPI